MNIKKIYEEIGGDYEGVSNRLPSMSMMSRFLDMFMESKDFDELSKAIANKDWELAFRSSHNIKGVSLNLGFTRLRESSNQLCEMFRYGQPTNDYSELYSKVEEDYLSIKEAIKKNLD